MSPELSLDALACLSVMFVNGGGGLMGGGGHMLHVKMFCLLFCGFDASNFPKVHPHVAAAL